MASVAILPVRAENGQIRYRAVSGPRTSLGESAGAALDALTAQIPQDELGTLVILQHRKPDQFFDAHQQQRLAQLMERHRQDGDLTPAERTELEQLVLEELEGSARRAAALADELGL